MRNTKRKSKLSKAFSLIELSIVILIIGILVAGVTQSSRLLNQMRLISARSQTLASPVPTIPNLISWYESVSDKSFDENQMSDQALLSNWYDINPTSTDKKNASQANDINKPQYSIDQGTGLPVVKFVDQDFFNLPNGTIPFANMPYTIIFVSRTNSFCVCGVMGSGSYNNNNQTNAFRYDPAAGVFYNYWFNVDLGISNASVINKLQIYTFTYNLSLREGFVDGVFKGSTPSSNRASTSINNTIGTTFTLEYMNGTIAEIIIFDRALKTEERKAIESYLGKKWRIPIQ
ncbi:hypothetical protein LBMAG18_03680 [Alphaproteobacteria bacterium]|nr:hypothetical protein LBMAG18_03680 [Alphaproteobacteria bacterium]